MGQQRDAFTDWIPGSPDTAVPYVLPASGNAEQSEWGTLEQAASHDQPSTVKIPQLQQNPSHRSNPQATQQTGARQCDETKQLNSDNVANEQDSGLKSGIYETLPQFGSSSSSKPVVDRYVAVGELGRGSWGVVERAIDHQLDREVAIKRLSSRAARDLAIQARFLHEAKVTSQLQHPNIVPVHELGTTGTGEAYYVMKLLGGSSLRDHIRQAHEPLIDKVPNADQLRQVYLPLLERFINVCQAIAYAHGRGIIHRDLKPANVMVGEFGETIVVDWGLAKQLLPPASTPASDPPHPDQPPHNLRSAATDDPIPSSAASWSANHRNASQTPENSYAQTVCGSIIGTPAYMPPEQAAGNVEQLDHRSDIYSLGVMLFEIVSGEIPLADSRDLSTMLQRVRSGDLPPLRKVQPAAPRALQAICAAAMAHRAEHRYQSAQQLAEDVKRFIAGDSVSVHREGMWELALRWFRRHQSIAVVSLASGVILLLASLAFGAVIHGAHQAESQARRAAEDAHREALANVSQAREAADAWLVDLSGVLESYPGLEPVRENLVLRAIRDYQNLANHDLREYVTQDPLTIAQFQLETARIQLRLADLLRIHPKLAAKIKRTDTSADESASQLYQQAEQTLLAIRQNRTLQKTGEVPADLLNQVKLEQINAHIGELLQAEDMHDTQPSMPAESLAELENWLVSQLPADCCGITTNTAHASGQPYSAFTARLVDAWTQLNFARVRKQSLLDDRSLAPFQAAVDAARWLTQHRGSTADLRLAETIMSDWAEQLENSGRFEAAHAARELLLSDLSQWSTIHPERPDLLQSMAMVKLQQAQSLAATSQPAPAIDLYKAALEDFNSAWRLRDADNSFQLHVAEVNLKLGSLLSRQPDWSLPQFHDAVHRLRQAIAAYQTLVQHETAEQALRRLSESQAALAEMLWTAGDETQLEYWESACRGYQSLVQRQLASPQDRLELAAAQLGWSRCLAEAGDLIPADKLLQNASGELSPWNNKLLPDDSRASEVQLLLRRVTADLRSQQGPAADAQTANREYLQLVQELAEAERKLGSSSHYPFACQRWVDQLLQPHDTAQSGQFGQFGQFEQSGQRQDEAKEWLDIMLELYPLCRDSAQWWQRRAMLAWLTNDLAAAEAAIVQCHALRQGDLLDDVMTQLIQVGQGVPLDAQRLQELRTACQFLPHHSRLQAWLAQLAP